MFKPMAVFSLLLTLSSVSYGQAQEIFCKEAMGKPLYFITSDRLSVYTFSKGKRSEPVAVTSSSSRLVTGTIWSHLPNEILVETSYVLADSSTLITRIPQAPESDGVGELRAENGEVIVSFEKCGETAQ